MVGNSPAKVGKKKSRDSAVRLFTETLIGAKLVPVGTVTVSEVVDADVTVALVAPK